MLQEHLQRSHLNTKYFYFVCPCGRADRGGHIAPLLYGLVGGCSNAGTQTFDPNLDKLDLY
jgi:hypothetical protein